MDESILPPGEDCGQQTAGSRQTRGVQGRYEANHRIETKFTYYVAGGRREFGFEINSPSNHILSGMVPPSHKFLIMKS